MLPVPFTSSESTMSVKQRRGWVVDGATEGLLRRRETMLVQVGLFAGVEVVTFWVSEGPVMAARPTRITEPRYSPPSPVTMWL
jgi:hypothetical protein